MNIFNKSPHLPLLCFLFLCPLILCHFFVTIAAADDLPHMKPGAWESTTTIKMGVPAGLPPAIAEAMAARMKEVSQPKTSRICYTEEDSHSAKSMLDQLTNSGNGALKCAPPITSKSGANVYNVATDCTVSIGKSPAGGIHMKSKSTLTEIDPEHYSMNVESTSNSAMGEQHQSIIGESRYLGSDCDQYNASTLEELRNKMSARFGEASDLAEGR